MAGNYQFQFNEALGSLRESHGRVIVEVGAIRNRESRDSDGHSTLYWPEDAIVWSVDVDPEAVKLTREMTADRPNVFCVLADGIAFLRAFPTRIDLLYLDGPDPDGGGNGRQWHFEAYRAAPMSQHAVLLIDDVNFPRLGKGEFVIPAAIEDGFQLIATDRQALLVR